MTAGLWEAGKLYPTGSVVQPVSAPAPISTAIVNAGFESGDVDWTKDAGWTIVTGQGPFAGSWSARWDSTSTGDIVAATPIAVVPGQSITAKVMVQQGASSAGQAGGRVLLVWYDSGLVELSTSLGSEVNSGSGGNWSQSTVTAVAPAGAAFVAVGARAFRLSGANPLWIDAFTWNYVAPPTTAGLIYKAVQPATGASGATEPTWPTTLGVQVVDNEVTWEAMAGTRVEWTAYPICKSGSPEPTWPLVPGGSVVDGNMVWRAITRRVTDENCPNTKEVAIAESHVFAGDDDIVRFCAAINPLDWTTRGDAGFLPTGLQQSNANGVKVLALYRKKLVPMNASNTQLWAIDPDPELMVPIDQIEGAGSIYRRAATQVGDDLFYLAALGVRTVGMTGASRNLSAGDVGAPIDDLVRAAMATAESEGVEPHSYYYPALGQYLLAFPRPENLGTWLPIAESEVGFAFSASAATMDGSNISYAGGGNGDFSLTLDPAAEPVLMRFTPSAWEAESDGDTAQFSWNNGGDVQPNVAADPDAAFEPSPFELEVDTDVDDTVLFSYHMEPEHSYTFLVEVWVPAAEPVPAGTDVFVFTRTKVGKSGSWSRYYFPFVISDFALLGNDLYFRHGDALSVFDTSLVTDETEDALQIAFGGRVRWNYLDCGQPGATKGMTGFDFVGTGLPSFSVGWDERFFDRATTPYAIDADTLPGGIIPLDVWGASFSMIVDFTPGTPWSLSSVILYIDEQGNGP